MRKKEEDAERNNNTNKARIRKKKKNIKRKQIKKEWEIEKSVKRNGNIEIARK